MHPIIKYGCFVVVSLCAAVGMIQAQGKASKADEMFIKEAMQGDRRKKRPKAKA